MSVFTHFYSLDTAPMASDASVSTGSKQEEKSVGHCSKHHFMNGGHGV
jgi:hypothetical protein